MNFKTKGYQFHHVGIPITEKRTGEKYSSTFKMYTSGGENEVFRIQYHRFEPDSPLHPLIQTKTHVAFKVASITEAIKGKQLLLDPYFPFPGFKVAIIEEQGMPIEFIETDLSEDEIWNGSKENTMIYPD